MASIAPQIQSNSTPENDGFTPIPGSSVRESKRPEQDLLTQTQAIIAEVERLSLADIEALRSEINSRSQAQIEQVLNEKMEMDRKNQEYYHHHWRHYPNPEKA